MRSGSDPAQRIGDRRLDLGVALAEEEGADGDQDHRPQRGDAELRPRRPEVLAVRPIVTETTWLAASGSHRMMSLCHSVGSVFSRIGMMNIRAITIAIVPAVCRTIEPTPYAISATSVTNSAVPMIAASTVDGWIRVPASDHQAAVGGVELPTGLF